MSGLPAGLVAWCDQLRAAVHADRDLWADVSDTIFDDMARIWAANKDRRCPTCGELTWRRTHIRPPSPYCSTACKHHQLEEAA